MQRFDRDQQTGLHLPEHARSIEGRLWESPDIGFRRAFVLEPGETRKEQIILPRKYLKKGTTRQNVIVYEDNPRSRYGQAFVELLHVGEDLQQYCLDYGIDSFDDIDQDVFYPEVTIHNFAKRSNIIQAKGGVFQLYLSNGRHLTGDDLKNSPALIDDSPISQDMLLVNENGMPVALHMDLDPLSRAWISEGEPPINIDPFSKNQRQLDTFLTPVPKISEVIPYLVYSKHRLRMPEGMYGVVRRIAYTRPNGERKTPTESVHGKAKLFHSGRNWYMIFELHGPTDDYSVATHVDVDLFENAV